MLEIFNQYRSQLFGIAYRMLGSVAEADDMVQETWLRWQKQDLEKIESPKSWLISAITRLCIDQLRSARRQREEYYGVWLPEPLVEDLSTSPENSAMLGESLTMAFMLMLETLDPVERAVFLLREVFDYEYRDIAAIVGKSEANCRQIVRRSKAQLLTHATAPMQPDERARRVVEQFVAATTTGEVKDLLALLTDDAVLYSDGGGQVSAAGRPICSADHVSRFLIGIRSRWPADMQLQYVSINGSPGVLMISQGKVCNAMVLEQAGERVKNIFIVRNPAKLQHLASFTHN